MNKKKIIIISAASLLLLGCMIGCMKGCDGGSEQPSTETTEEVKECKLRPETTAVKGSFKDYFEVVDREYKLIDGFSAKIKVELKRTETPFAFDTSDVASMYNSNTSQSQVFGFGMEFLDEDGGVIVTENPYSKDEDLLLFNLNAGETGTVEFSIFHSDDEREVRNNAVKFRITSILKNNEDKNDGANKTTGSSKSNDEVDTDDLDDAVKSAQKTMEVTKQAVEAVGELYKLADELDN